MDEIGIRYVFEQAMKMWFGPEIARRQAAGTAPTPLVFFAGQVIFHADGRGNEVRLNDEIQICGKVKVKVAKEKGEWISDDEIEQWGDFFLPDSEDPNCGHFTAVRIRESWTICFDFVYNKGRSRELLETAREFLDCAEYAL